jgi:hypothetical protein
MKINWNIIPTHTIDVGKLSDPYEICDLLKQHKIRKYVYRIKYKGIVIKYGMSADRSRNYGDRLYRQIAHSESWGARRNNGSSGSDWRIIEDDFYKLYGSKIDKADMTIKIWNLSAYPFVSINTAKEVFYIEQNLIEAYTTAVGEKPIGNINDDTNYKRKGYIPKKLFGNDGLFED